MFHTSQREERMHVNFQTSLFIMYFVLVRTKLLTRMLSGHISSGHILSVHA
jgi:hypothetical protein